MKSILRAPLHIANNLTTTAAGYTLDARQGTALQMAMERKAPGGMALELRLSVPGWYRVARYVGDSTQATQGTSGVSVLLAYSTYYGGLHNMAGLLSVNLVYLSGTIASLGWAKYNAVDPVISQARLVYDAADGATYVELYYNTSKGNSLCTSILGGATSDNARWEPMRPTPASGTPTVYATADLTQPPMTQQEAGTWTPILYGTTTAGNPTYGTRWGRYVRQGTQVHIRGYIGLQSLGGIAGQVAIRGLPYAASAQGVFAPVTLALVTRSTAAKPITGLVGTVDPTGILLYTAQTALLYADGLADTSEIHFSSIYFA